MWGIGSSLIAQKQKRLMPIAISHFVVNLMTSSPARAESASSSEVENLTSSGKQVAMAEIGDSSSGNAELVVSNIAAMNAAMNAAIKLADDLNPAAILTMHRSSGNCATCHRSRPVRDHVRCRIRRHQQRPHTRTSDR